MATVVKSGAPTLASGEDEALEEVAPRRISVKHEPTGMRAAMSAMLRTRGFANSLGDSGVKRSVQAFKIASPVRFLVKTT
jgi:hypothetical protein